MDEPEEVVQAAAASSYLDELVPYLVLLGNTLLFAVVRRLAARLSPLKWRLAISETIGTWELCSDVAELGIVYERHGVWVYALALLACCVWWCRAFGDAEACPCGPVEDMLFAIGPGDYRARLLGQALGGLLTAQYITFIWSWHLIPEHKTMATTECQTSLMGRYGREYSRSRRSGHGPRTRTTRNEDPGHRLQDRLRKLPQGEHLSRSTSDPHQMQITGTGR
ncbi:aquaporin isoform X3 [Dermacentor variabilis]|uniref:aquaporin isoform X3 n=1 Tax=Dermacentor variabilis TaxID=34621 RepID=UPI003F5CAE1E